jgi:hypothetical protein
MKLNRSEPQQLLFILEYIADYASRGDLPNQGEPDDGSDTDAIINFTNNLLQTHFPESSPNDLSPEGFIAAFQKGFVNE